MVGQVIQESLQAAREQMLPVMAVAALGSMALAPVADAAVANQARQPMRTMQQEPGYDLSLSSQAQASFLNSVVKLGRRTYFPDQGRSYPNGEWCSGLKITLSGTTRESDYSKSYVMSAAHCAEEETGSQNGIYHLRGQPRVKAERFDFAAIQPSQFDILDPRLPVLKGASTLLRENWPIADTSSVATSTDNLDVALFKPTPPDPAQQTAAGVKVRPYPGISGLRPSQFTTENQKLLPGQKVLIEGMSQINQYKSVEAIGRLLGRFYAPMYQPSMTSDSTIEAGRKQELDIVAMHASSPTTDTCMNGSSGVGGKTAQGPVLGPLSLRVTAGYGPYHDLYSAPFQYDRKVWQTIAKESHTQLPYKLFNVMCGFTVLKHTTLIDLAKARVMRSHGIVA